MIDFTKIEEKKCPEIIHVLMETVIENGEEFLPGWYFWDETWATRHGPFATYEEVTAALNNYCDTLD